MTSTDDAPEKKKICLIELVMVIALISVITVGALEFDSLDGRSKLFRTRTDHWVAASAVSPENKAVVDAYVACWKDDSRKHSPDCALDAVALGRSQGRTEEGVSELIASMGIFENGCGDSNPPRNLMAVMKNEELLTLMGTWCSSQRAKKAP
jgi:hypothetical protein